MTAMPSRAARLLPVHPAHRGGGADAVALIAHRLHSRFAGEPMRTLEAIAAAEVNRLDAHGEAGRPTLPPAPDDERGPAEDRRYAVCRRVARRALAGALQGRVGHATRYHREDASPPWARERLPVAEIGGFVFYAD